jgi:mono/diheme cytochrome c family protein
MVGGWIRFASSLTRHVATASVVAVVLMTLAAAQATAQQSNLIDFGRRLYQEKANCGFCHGWSGDGAGDPHSPGIAANLRTTAMDRDALEEVIRCGRPGTAMPRYFQFAWSKGDECFGMVESELGAPIPGPAGNTLQRREINAVLDYLFADVIGKGKPTAEECDRFFGGKAILCDQMRARAN